MINVSGVRKSFGARVLFDGIDLRLGARDRVALVGPNGSGKTTLMEMIVGRQEPDSGRVDVQRDANIGYLAQETDALRHRPVLQEVLSAAPSVSEAGHRLEILHREIADATSDEERAVLLDEYATLQTRFESLGGYSAEAEAHRILRGLGFSPEDVERNAGTLSGGWLMRVALAKLLLASPDVLLLDEPTNHLDVESVVWLEGFLRQYPGAILLVSHDRDFMNGLATHVAEIDAGRLQHYTGDYEAFTRQRAQRAEQLLAAAKNQQARVAQLEKFIERFRYKQSKARQVQSKIKMVGKMDRIDAGPSKQRVMRFGFPTPPRSGRVVIELDRVSFAYPDKKVYEGLDVAIERGEKVVLVGPNGAGKTTLLKLLAGVLEPIAGERRLGHNVSLGYFAQHQIEALDPSNRIIQELERALPPGSQVRPRDLLGRFLFSGDDVDKPVAVLSGGERSRLALTKLMVEPHNVLCLDEPTNHLDIASRDVLEDALADYEGALVFITHDRHLIRSVATRVIEVVDGHVRSFPGDYEAYLWRKEQEADAARDAASRERTRRGGGERGDGGRANDEPSAKERRRASAGDRQRTAKRRNAIKRIEEEMERLTAKRDELAAVLADPAFYAAGEGVSDAVAEYDRTGARVAELESEWVRLSEEAEADRG